ncbi:MAG TPA: thioredoxin family protein [Bdellovibrionales bacterium]|nr:thioredoxin family protein [Bdellovibrionales bacterium]
MALTYTPDPEIGKPCPDFTLPATDGKTYSRSDFAGSDAFLVMFICNHCPYVQAIQDRLVELGRHFEGKSVKIAAISSNDADEHPEDSFPKMKELAEAKRFPFPYLYDESQQVAKTFGAVCTPDFFLYDRSMMLTYRGRLDDSWKDPKAVRTQELKNAIEALLAGRKPSADQTPSMGCNIKWKKA